MFHATCQVAPASTDYRLSVQRWAESAILSLLLYLLTYSTTAPLQRVQNAAARLGPRDHVTPTLKDRHWLPIEQRIVFKLCLLMHLVHSGVTMGFVSSLPTHQGRQLRVSPLTPFFLEKKTGDLLVINVCRLRYLFSPAKTDDMFCSSLSLFIDFTRPVSFT